MERAGLRSLTFTLVSAWALGTMPIVAPRCSLPVLTLPAAEHGLGGMGQQAETSSTRAKRLLAVASESAKRARDPSPFSLMGSGPVLKGLRGGDVPLGP
ncbi:unnamed protein product [Rangifer tarandus platyrhynchus]|uniref:Secreted protein n=1 Tax=Rangifer tarandus platyrhynchus TaxID=3082113 RepID=A0ABN8YI20_RANTA|nr:unnamed protein product [Rangifer tarandus platyrhynchus]